MQHQSVKRHLPVVKSADSSESAPQAPWLWVLFAGIVSLSLWVPLATFSLTIGKWLGPSTSACAAPVAPAISAGTVALPTAGLVVLSFALACTAGGALLRRFSGRATSWDPALSGACTAFLILFFAALGHALAPVSVGASVAAVLLVLGPTAAAIGGRLARPRSTQVR